MDDKKIPHITCEHLTSLCNDPQAEEHTVIDLRDPLEFDAGHIEGSKNIPRRELTDNIGNVIPHTAHRVIVVVGPTAEAEIAAINEELVSLGYERVEFLAGGFDRWCEISMPSLGEEESTELTPEESGSRGDDEIDSYEGEDPEEENEPLM